MRQSANDRGISRDHSRPITRLVSSFRSEYDRGARLPPPPVHTCQSDRGSFLPVPRSTASVIGNPTARLQNYPARVSTHPLAV